MIVIWMRPPIMSQDHDLKGSSLSQDKDLKGLSLSQGQISLEQVRPRP